MADLHDEKTVNYYTYSHKEEIDMTSGRHGPNHLDLMTRAAIRSVKKLDGAVTGNLNSYKEQ